MTPDSTQSSPPGRQPSRSDGKRRIGVLLSLAVSGLLLFGLYRNLDVRAVGVVLRSAHVGWLIVSVSMIAPITVLMSLRFLWIVPAGCVPGLMEAVRLTLVANAANMFLPAKTGDLVKSYFVARQGGTTAGIAIAVIVYERISDLFGLIVCCLLGLLFEPALVSVVPTTVWLLLSVVGAVCLVLLSSDRITERLHNVSRRLLARPRLEKVRLLTMGWPDLHRELRGRRTLILLYSVFLWFVHLTQIWLFTVALAAPVPLMVCFSLSALALLAGQLPFTFAGIGVRDVALVALLSPYMTPEGAAAMGILTMSRSFLPPLAALPILRPYLAVMFREVQQAAT